MKTEMIEVLAGQMEGALQRKRQRSGIRYIEHPRGGLTEEVP